MTVPFSLLPDRSPATLAALKQCAEGYNVSLIAAALAQLHDQASDPGQLPRRLHPMGAFE